MFVIKSREEDEEEEGAPNRGSMQLAPLLLLLLPLININMFL